jgi:hypothetical protein
MNAQQVFGFVTYDKTAPLSLIFVIKKKGVATTLNFRSTNKKPFAEANGLYSVAPVTNERCSNNALIDFVSIR